jgi:hypothetical protein
MWIFAAADVNCMTTERGCEPLPADGETPIALRLMAEGVPLALLVDLALPIGLDFDPSRAPNGPDPGSHTSPTRTGHYRE